MATLEDQKELLHGPEFTELLRNIVTEAVAEGVSRATEAAAARITALEEELADTKARLAVSEQRVEELDNYNRRSSVIISGVPEKPGETTDRLVVDVGRAAGVNMSADHIDISYRLGHKQVGKTRPIMVKFTSSGAKQKLMEKRKELAAENVKNHPTLTRPTIDKIFISESLTPKSQHLLFVARQLKKKQAVWAAYSTNGRVKVKKTANDAAVIINDFADLEKLADAATLREFRPRGKAATGPAQRGADLTWQATDAINGWVTERRRRTEAPGGSHPRGADGQRT